MTDSERENFERIVKELEARLDARPISELVSKLSDVLGKLHVINGEANLLANFPEDPHLKPRERGLTIQEYRLIAHRLVCEVIDGIRAQPSLSDAIKEVEKMRDGWDKKELAHVEKHGTACAAANEFNVMFRAANEIVERLKSLSTQRES